MASNKVRPGFCRHAFQSLNDVPLDAAHIGYDYSWFEMRQDLFEQRLHLSEGRAEHDQLGSVDGFLQIKRGEIDGPSVLTFANARLPPDETCNHGSQTLALQRHPERAAKQTYSNQRDLCPSHTRIFRGAMDPFNQNYGRG